MATMPADLRALITSSTAITALVSTRVHYNHLPESSARPHIWYRVASDNEELTMDGTGGLHEAFVDLECVGVTEDSAQDLADAVKEFLHGHKGAMGASTASAIFVTDKDDDYVPFAIESDEGAHVDAYTLHIWYARPDEGLSSPNAGFSQGFSDGFG